MNQVHTGYDYLVEMAFAPLSSPPSPPEAAAFLERFVQPTLAACRDLLGAGRIVAGGPALAAGGLHFIARVTAPHELEDMLVGLPLWSRAQTRVVPLGTFERRAQLAEERLLRIRGQSSTPAGSQDSAEQPQPSLSHRA